MKAKPRQLKMQYSQKENDIQFAWGEGVAKADAGFLCFILTSSTIYHGKTFQEELIERGYDITTIKFSISLKDKPLPAE